MAPSSTELHAWRAASATRPATATTGAAELNRGRTASDAYVWPKLIATPHTSAKASAAAHRAAVLTASR